jgi:hypothetical protein
VLRRDSFRTVIRTLFLARRGRDEERSPTWRRGRKTELKGRSCRNPEVLDEA